jgi:hypothetical protein
MTLLNTSRPTESPPKNRSVLGGANTPAADNFVGLCGVISGAKMAIRMKNAKADPPIAPKGLRLLKLATPCKTGTTRCILPREITRSVLAFTLPVAPQLEIH